MPNASPSINGWFFQISAGLYLFLRDIKHSDFLKIEGENEDIEIGTAGGLVYAQAKSLSDVNNRSSVPNAYKRALESLKNNKDKAAELLYISNIQDPFNDGQEKYYDYGSEFSFSQLRLATQEKIRTFLGGDFEYGKLRIVIVPFYGDERTKASLVTNELGKFLVGAKVDPSYKEAIYDTLITLGLENASQKKWRISKNTLVFHIALPYLESYHNREADIASDPDNYETARERYRAFLKNLEADYKLFARVITRYAEEKKTTNCDIASFVKNNATEFLEFIPENYHEEIRLELVRILVYRVLQQRFTLDGIRKEANIKW